MEKFNKAVTDLMFKLIRNVIQWVCNALEPINILKKTRKRKRSATDEEHIGSELAETAEVSQNNNASNDSQATESHQHEPEQPAVLQVQQRIEQGPPRKKPRVSEVPFKDRKEIFKRKEPIWCKICPEAYTPIFLNIFKLQVLSYWCGAAGFRGKQFDNIHLGLISSSKIPKMNDFIISTKVGTVECEKVKDNESWIMTPSDFNSITKFHRCLFENLLKTSDKKYFRPEEASMRILVVPVKEIGCEYEIQFELMKISSQLKLPKDLGNAHQFKNIYTKISFLPQILHRLGQLLIAEELHSKISSSGYMESFEEIKWEKIHFNKSSQEKGFDIYGPSPFSVLHAMTLKEAREIYDMERFEILGDSFLEYITAIKCYHENPHDSVTNLAMKCISKVNNAYLYEKAKNKNLEAFLIKDNFSENNFTAPLYINKTEESVALPCKYLSDMVEALIGLYVIKSGQHGGLIIMTWLGLEPIPNKQTNEITKEDLTNYPRALTIPEYPNIPYTDEILNKIQHLENKLHYNFMEKSFILEAITHSTHAQDTNVQNNRRLSFIGQRVLYFIITKIFFNDRRQLSPGIISKLRSKLIKAQYHGFLAVKFQFIEYLQQVNLPMEMYVKNCKGKEDYKFFEEKLYLPESLESSGGKATIIFADLFRSIAAAIYLDSKNLDQVWTIYREMMEPALLYWKNSL